MTEQREPDPLTDEEINEFVRRLAQSPTLDAAGNVDRITALEKVKSACAAAQIAPTIAIARPSTITKKVTSDGTTLTRTGDRRNATSQIALARRTSPYKGAQSVRLAEALNDHMPHTCARLTSGDLTEWRATILVTETHCLTPEQRSRVDRELCADPATLTGCGDRDVAARAKNRAAQINPAAVAEKAKKAEGQRRVSTRPAPDSMAYCTALVPMTVAVCMYATLRRDATKVLATDDDEERTLGQIMADLLVNRVLGTEHATDIPVEVNLVMSDDSDRPPACPQAHSSATEPSPR